MGKVSKIPGLYFSVPVSAEGRVVGVAAVKINVPVLAHWVRQADAFVTDEYGVVILASDAKLDMRSVPGATVASLSRADRVERYRREEFPALSIVSWPAAFIEPLFQMDGEEVPVLLTDRFLDDERINIHVFSRFRKS